MSKKVIIFTVGTTPQVITEVLYAVWKNNKEMYPEEIFAITSENGKKILQNKLCGEQGKLMQFFQECKAPVFDFNIDKHVFVLKNLNTNEYIKDPRISSEQDAIADFIFNTISKFTNKRDEYGEPCYQIHASIAGGRKTMAYILGFVMNILANPKDILSHVLINEAYERSDFWYPTKESRIIKCGSSQLDCKDCQVTLSQIPLIKLRSLINKNKDYPISELGFTKTVELINKSLSIYSHNVYVKLHKKSVTMEVFYGNSSTVIQLDHLTFAMCAMLLCNLPDAPSISSQTEEKQYIYLPSIDKPFHQTQQFIKELFRAIPVDNNSVSDSVNNILEQSMNKNGKLTGHAIGEAIATINDYLSKTQHKKKHFIQEGSIRQKNLRSNDPSKLIDGFKCLAKRTINDYKKLLKNSNLPLEVKNMLTISNKGKNRNPLYHIGIKFKNINIDNE